MIKKISITLIILILIIIFPFGVSAEDELPEEYKDMVDSIPDDVAQLLPDGIFSSELSEVEGAVNEMSSWDFIWNTVFEMIGLNIDDALRIFAVLTGLLLLCSLLSRLHESIKNEKLSTVIPMVGGIIIVSAILLLAKAPLERIETFFADIRLFVNTMSPVICSLYAMGGNVSVAVVQSYGMITFLAIFENVCILALETIVGICMALAVASSLAPNINLKPLGDTIKRIFTFFVGLLMLIFTTVLSTQTLLASNADSLGAKTAKMFAGQMIPLVGGTVGESLRTAGASIEYLRSTVGVGVIIIFLLLVLPTILSIICFRFSFIAASAVSALLGCEREGRLINEMASIYGYVLAIASICAISLLLLLTLFARCSSALSG